MRLRETVPVIRDFAAMARASAAVRREAVAARIDAGEKRCARCHVVKNFAAFATSPRTPDGHHGWCKGCNAGSQAALKQWRQEQIEAARYRPSAPPPLNCCQGEWDEDGVALRHHRACPFGRR